MRIKHLPVILSSLAVVSSTILSCAPPSGQSAISSSPLSEQNAKTILPYVFEGIMQAGVQNASPVEVILDTTLPTTPSRISIYKVVNPTVDDNYASNLARQLGFSGEPVPLRGSGPRQVYTYISGTEVLEINLDGSIALRNKASLTAPQSLPSEQETIAIAQDWLKSHNLYPDGVTAVKTSTYGVTVVETSPYRTVAGNLATRVRFTISLDGYNTSLGVSVAVAEGGRVIEVRTNTPRVEKYTTITTLKTGSKALDILKGYLSSPSASPPEAKECIATLRAFARLVIKNISIQYWGASSGYLQPVYVFEGDAYPYRGNSVEKFIGRVDAVQR